MAERLSLDIISHDRPLETRPIGDLRRLHIDLRRLALRQEVLDLQSEISAQDVSILKEQVTTD